MRTFAVAENLDLNTAASQTEIDMSAPGGNLIPFVANYSAVVQFFLTAPAGTSIALEGRDDPADSFVALATILNADGQGIFQRNITLTQEIRVTVVGTAGAGEIASVQLLQN